MDNFDTDFGEPLFTDDNPWDMDTSQYIYDSPQPERNILSSSSKKFDFGSQNNATQAGTSSGKARAPKASTALDSSESPPSSFGSSADSAALVNPKSLVSTSTSPPQPVLGQQPVQLVPGDMHHMFDANGSRKDGSGYNHNNKDAFVPVNTDMDTLSLNSEFGFATAAPLNSSIATMWDNNENSEYANRAYGNTNTGNDQVLDSSPQQMTVAPSKMFSLESGEDSPNDFMNMDDSNASSPYNNNPYSPFMGNMNTLNPTVSSAETAARLNFHAKEMAMRPAYGGFGQPMDNNGRSSAVASPNTSAVIQSDKFPCRLSLDPIPEKSRVETQIPIFLHVQNPPPAFNRIHLPGYTISKPKFQTKPAHEKQDDTLELSVLLFCASAMASKEGAMAEAFRRAQDGEITERKEDPPDLDEDHPDRPLNGGPVAICSGCVVRERKRAARKKTKKIEEEEEWAKEEAKRVIVFNCPEVKDFIVGGTKETTVKEHSGALDEMYVHVPMRIACYCRHQNEKLGFQVVFTLRKPDGEILGQAMSPSIMITDDHKQPPPNPHTMPFPAQMPDQEGFYTPQQPGSFDDGSSFVSNPEGNMPFRPAYSVPNLAMMNNPHYQSYSSGLPRHSSSNNLTRQRKSNTTTPRHQLSRPASPSYLEGQPNKKRRSGGPGHGRFPSGLSMTRLDTSRTPMGGTGPLTAGPTSSGFNFASPTSGDFGNTMLNDSLSHAQTLRNQAAGISGYHPHQSGPTTPLFSSQSRAAMTPSDLDYSQFYSAQTSQHHSRAPSPSSRFAYMQNHAHGMLNSNANALANSVPARAAAALSALPPGFNLNQPPIIQRLVPASGPPQGGADCTILGSNFFQGLQVMFGDSPARQVTYWGPTTLVCKTPPSCIDGLGWGSVVVLFQHQHVNTEANVSNVPALMPATTVSYTYVDDVKHLPSLHSSRMSQPPNSRLNKKKSKSGAASPGARAGLGGVRLGGDGMPIPKTMMQGPHARGFYGQQAAQAQGSGQGQGQSQSQSQISPARAARIMEGMNAFGAHMPAARGSAVRRPSGDVRGGGSRG